MNEYQIPYSLKLQKPIEWGKDKDPVGELVFKRELKAGDLKNIPAGNEMKIGHLMGIISKMTGQPLSFIEELSGPDLFKAIEVVNSFLPDGPESGGS